MKVTKKAIYKRRYLKTESLLTQTRRLLRRFDLRVRKGLGQHFLIDEEALKLITVAAQLTPADVVMEIGPGLGVLTREIAKQAAWVLAIELDNKLAAILKQTLASFNNVTIINADILGIAPEALLQEAKAEFPSGVSGLSCYKVVANLPYYITSPTLRHFLEASVKPQIMVVMVQKEVAEGIVAEPGRMSLLSVSVQLYGEPTIVGYVPAQCFYPAPEVDEVVRAGFCASRKQIGNSLAQGLELPKAEVLSLLDEAGVVPQRRAETLTLEEWARLWRVSTRAGESVC